MSQKSVFCIKCNQTIQVFSTQPFFTLSNDTLYRLSLKKPSARSEFLSTLNQDFIIISIFVENSGAPGPELRTTVIKTEYRQVCIFLNHAYNQLNLLQVNSSVVTSLRWSRETGMLLS